MKELIETGCLWQDEDCEWANFFDGDVTQENILKFASTFCDRCLKVRQIGVLEDLNDLKFSLESLEREISNIELDVPVDFNDRRMEKPLGYDERMERRLDRYREDDRREGVGRYGLDWFEGKYPRYPRGYRDYRDWRSGRDRRDRRDSRYR